MTLSPGFWYRIHFGPTGKCYQIILEIEELDDSFLNTFMYEMTAPIEADGTVFKTRIADPGGTDSFSLCSDGMYKLEGTSTPDLGTYLPFDPAVPRENGYTKNDGNSTKILSAPIPVDHPDHWLDPDLIGWSYLSIYFTAIATGSSGLRWNNNCPTCAEAVDGTVPPPADAKEFVAAFPAIFMLPNPDDAGAKKISKRKIKVRWEKDK